MVRAKGLVLNAVFYPSFVLFTLLSTAVLAPWVLWGRVRFGSGEVGRRLRRIIPWYGQTTFRGLPTPFLRVRYEDRTGGEKDRKPYVVICNHRSASDAFMLSFLPFEQTVQVLNVWPFKIPILGRMARLAGYLSVNELPYPEFQARCRDLLARGVALAAFPEGTRSGSTRLGQFKSAIFRIAQEARATIVPLCISGTEDKPRRDSLWLNPGTVRVRRLADVPYETYRDFSPFKLKTYIRGLIEAETRSLDGEA